MISNEKILQELTKVQLKQNEVLEKLAENLINNATLNKQSIELSKQLFEIQKLITSNWKQDTKKEVDEDEIAVEEVLFDDDKQIESEDDILQLLADECLVFDKNNHWWFNPDKFKKFTELIVEYDLKKSVVKSLFNEKRWQCNSYWTKNKIKAWWLTFIKEEWLENAFNWENFNLKSEENSKFEDFIL